MTVYVDDMRAPYGRMVMCHMIADTTEELHAMASAIGMNLRWVQDAGTHREHFDVALTRRAHAVQLGAKEISRHELAQIIYARRAGPPVPLPPVADERRADPEPREPGLVAKPIWLPKEAPEGACLVVLPEGVVCPVVYVRSWLGVTTRYLPEET